MSTSALSRESEKRFERIRLQNFTDTLQHICYRISGADFGKSKYVGTKIKIH